MEYIEHPYPEPEDDAPQCTGIICLAQYERRTETKSSIGFMVYKVSFGRTNENKGKGFTTLQDSLIVQK